MNPEFHRNLLLQFSAQRLVAAPAVLAIIFGLVFTISTDTGPLAWLARWGFLLFALLWGTRRAADAVAEEVNGGTWDSQRMSALGAWSMAWGKLLGATVYTWYCALLCLAVYAAALAGGGVFSARGVGLEVLVLIEGALISQAVAMGTSLALWRKRLGRRPLRVAAGQLAGIGAGIAASIHVPGLPAMLVERAGLDWYGLGIDQDLFAVASLAVFFGWALLGVYRLMLQELQYRTWPWAWTLFVLFCLGYVAGFAVREFDFLHEVANWRLSVLSIAIALVYAALFIEPKSPIRYRQFLGAFRRGDGGRLFAAMPLWLPTWLIAAAAILAVASTGAGNTFWSNLTLPLAVALLLFMLRDIVFVLALNFGRSPGRGDVAAFLYLIVAYVPLGWLLSRLEEPLALALVVPVTNAGPLVAILPVAVELAVVLVFLVFRWRRYGVPRVAGAVPAAA